MPALDWPACETDKPLHDGRLGRIRPSVSSKAAVFIGSSSEKLKPAGGVFGLGSCEEVVQADGRLRRAAAFLFSVSARANLVSAGRR